MLNAKKVILGLGLLTALVIGGCFHSVSTMLGDDMCGNSPSRTVISPDGRLKAVVFERDCGATTGFSMQVSVLGAKDRLPNKSGNVFVDGDNAPVTVAWASANNLTVRYNPQARVFVRNTRVLARTGLFGQQPVSVRYGTATTPEMKTKSVTHLVPH